MDNVSRNVDILRKNQKAMLKIKNTVIKMKNVFSRLFSRLDTAKKSK